MAYSKNTRQKLIQAAMENHANRKRITSNNSTITISNATIIGNNNNIIGDNNQINGNNNDIIGDNNTVRGNNNDIKGDHNKIFGNNNSAVGHDDNNGEGKNNDFGDDTMWVTRGCTQYRIKNNIIESRMAPPSSIPSLSLPHFNNPLLKEPLPPKDRIIKEGEQPPTPNGLMVDKSNAYKTWTRNGPEYLANAQSCDDCKWLRSGIVLPQMEKKPIYSHYCGRINRNIVHNETAVHTHDEEFDLKERRDGCGYEEGGKRKWGLDKLDITDDIYKEVVEFMKPYEEL